MTFLPVSSVFDWMGIEVLGDDSSPDPLYSPRNLSDRPPRLFNAKKHLPHLEYLHINGLPTLSDQFVSRLPHSLQTLAFPRQTYFKAASIKAHLPNLTCLNLHQFPDLELQQQLAWPEHLTEFHLQAIPSRSAAVFEPSLPMYLTHLECPMVWKRPGLMPQRVSMKYLKMTGAHIYETKQPIANSPPSS